MNISIPEKTIKDYSSVIIPELTLKEAFVLFTEMKDYYYKVLHLSVQCDFDTNFNCKFEIDKEATIDMFYEYDEYMDAGFKELMEEYGEDCIIYNFSLKAPIRFDYS